MHTTVKISKDLKRAIMLRSHHQRDTKKTVSSKPRTRSEAEYGTKAYRDGLQRAFAKAKEQIYFNPDMTYFITLTYRGKNQTPEDVLRDVKLLIKQETRANERNSPAGSGRNSPKYIYVMEYQKRGSIHVHMIANNGFTLQVNANGHKELTYWRKGFSSVLTIQDFDRNFRPYLYLFKYMRKAQRIGRSFLHSSRNLGTYDTLHDASIDLLYWRTITQEYTHTTVETTNFHFYKNYLEYDDTMTSQPSNLGDHKQWHEQVKLHSNKALEQILASRILRSN
ncbi:MAG: Rep protein [Circular genetic element sp.]|nr:MAG: Rep protein [Circular genetic element sp.]